MKPAHKVSILVFSSTNCFIQVQKYKKIGISIFLYGFYLFFSKKKSNFAVVIEISRHIEILLLSNDCVIVPGLGGFMAHHIDSRYEEDENIFLPPLRTLGFNPQLKINDSLLAQSYVEAYDISYPEALRRIEDEVNEMTQHINNKGSYELIGIGTLSKNSDGNYIFAPCEAGILTPSLYALSTFEFPQLAIQPKTTHVAPTVIETPVAKPVSVAKAAPVAAKAAPEEKKSEPEETERPKLIQFEDSQDDDTDALIIKLSWIRNAVAVAAAVIMFILITTPISNSDPNLEYSQLGTPAIFDTTKKNVDPVMKDTKALEHEIAQDSIMRAIAKADSIASAKADSIATAKAVEEKKDSVVKDVTGYCLVLASYVSMKNANAYVERLHKAGFTEAEVYVRNKVTRVVYGNFQSMNDAYNRLNQIRRGNKDFEEAWVLKTTDRG